MLTGTRTATTMAMLAAAGEAAIVNAGMDVRNGFNPDEFFYFAGGSAAPVDYNAAREALDVGGKIFVMPAEAAPAEAAWGYP